MENARALKMAPSDSSSPTITPHIVVFPFMSKGHTIPLLHLSRLLLLRGATVTIFTTPANRPFISRSLPPSSGLSVVDLPFPSTLPDIPTGVESTDKLPSISLFIPFVNATKLMRPSFEAALAALGSQVSCLVSDGFLHWTLDPAERLGIPRIGFYGMSHHAAVLSRAAAGLLSLQESDEDEFQVPGFPWVKLCRNDFDHPFCEKDPRGAHWDFILEAGLAMVNSYGVVVNSFYEMEKPFADHADREGGPKTWSVGPLCLASPLKINELGQKPTWIEWLDRKWAEGGSPVLYIAFGSQANISSAQLREIAHGLENSNARFLWVVRSSKGDEIDGDFEERVKGRGIIVSEWVDQREILEHPFVQGFVSHCGWNSVLEGICAAVPILAWPMMAEQYLNAKFVTEEIKIGLRVKTVDGTRKGFVTGESLKNTVVELMEGEKGKKLRENVKEVAEAARKSMAEGGSSWMNLNRMIEETCKHKEINTHKLQQLEELKMGPFSSD